MHDPGKELAVRLQAGTDTEAFETLYDTWSGRIYTFCLGYLGDRDDADDCSQDIFVRIFRHAISFRFESSFDTWIYRIMINCCNDYYRQKRRRGTAVEVTEAERSLMVDNTPETELSVAEAWAAFNRELPKLKPGFRTVLILRDIEGRSYEEIAGITGLSPGTVRSRLARARRKMADKLNIYRDELQEG